MTCSCTNTTTLRYTITQIATGYRISGNGATTSCGGTLNVVPSAGYDCLRLVFDYAESADDDELLPLISAGTCPCETESNPSRDAQQFIGRFQVPQESASCSYLWTLKASQPPCRIDIVIHAP
jgi:hypothetical protein